MFRRATSSSAVPGATLVRQRLGIDFSFTTVVFVSMMLFMGLAAVNSQANLLFGVFGLMLGILLVSGIISRFVLKRLAVRRILPEYGSVGQPLWLEYQVTNEKRFWPSLSISIAELDGVEAFTTQPQGYMLHAAARMTASVPAPVVPKRRGLHEFDRYQVSTSFPFGFVKRAITARHKDVMLIHPALAVVDPRLLRMCRSADMTGETIRPQSGGADEFYGVKEYRRGDNPKWIYWRRSARSGTLVSKEMTRVSPPRIVLLLDTYAGPSASWDSLAAVERSIAQAASLSAVALSSGLSVGLCVWSGEWLLLPPTRGKRHSEDLLSVFARLPRNASHGLEELLERGQSMLHAATTPIVFTPREIDIKAVEKGRGGMIVIPAASAQASGWFTFGAAVDFTHAMPPDQIGQPSKRPWSRAWRLMPKLRMPRARNGAVPAAAGTAVAAPAIVPADD